MTQPSAFRVAAAGMVSLGVAMGIGRFAFTPLLPMMLADGVVDLPTAGWLASANYFGYLLGALLCTFWPWIAPRVGWRRPVDPPAWVRGALATTVVLTLGMALPVPAAWAPLRFAAGVASAFAFIYTTGWCLAQFARLQLPAAGAYIYVGPGLGIMLGGLAAGAMVALHWSAAQGWLAFGVLAALLTAAVWPVYQPGAGAGPGAAAGAATAAAESAVRRAEMPVLAVAYGLAGFGYIITGTFLPVIARQALPGSAWLDMFWPVFGGGVVVGALFASRMPARGDHRIRLAACYAIQAAGILVGLLSPTLAGFALGSLLLGLPFTAITFFAMQEVRRIRPVHTASAMGLLTAMYGIGQIVGPPLAGALVARSGNAARGFDTSLELAAGSLVAGALAFAWLARRYPAER